jgi:hypothetical protein
MTDPLRRGSRGKASSRPRRVSEPFTEADRIADLETRLARLERLPTLRQRGQSLMDRVMPPEATEHFRNAGREQLLGVRSIVDYWIGRLDEAESRADRRSRGREEIKID